MAAAPAKLLSRSLAARQPLPFNHYTASFDDSVEESERFSGATDEWRNVTMIRSILFFFFFVFNLPFSNLVKLATERRGIYVSNC